MTFSFALYRATAADWSKIPLIYEVDGYDGAAALMREGASREVSEFEAGDRVLFLAQNEGRVIGTVGLVFRGKDAGYADGVTSANVSRLHVVQSERRKGVGTALLAAAEEEARSRGYARITIEVETEEDSAAARMLYEKRGYRRIGPGHHPNEIALELQLSAPP